MTTVYVLAFESRSIWILEYLALGRRLLGLLLKDSTR
jgi:hypothetical protein